MKKVALILLCMVFAAVKLVGQVDTLTVTDTTLADTVTIPSPIIDTAAALDTAWSIGGNFGLQFTQAAYSNWRAGGVNSIAGNALLSIFSNYDNGGNWTWMNSLVLGYGMNYQDTVYNKTDDRIEFESRVDRRLTKIWSASALVNFRTQFTNGYAEPGQQGDSVRVSTFMAPAYLIAGVGFTYKPNKKFSAFLSPLTSKMTFVQDQRLSNKGAFGVDTGETFRQEIGGYVNMNYKTPLVKNVDMQARLDLYSNYLNGNYKYIDVNGELMLFMKINRYLTANVALNVIYDHDILFDTNNDGNPDGPRTQLKEVLGVGFVYNFGDRGPKK